MQRYKAIIAYDGTDFAGFQRQNQKRTVQGELEQTLTRLNSGQEVIVHGSGRTDAGVHAQGQVIHFDMINHLPKEKLRFALDTQSSDDISVSLVEKVTTDFHARYMPHEKCYQYTIDLKRAADPLLRRYAWHYRYDLDFNLMREAITYLEGTHDFTSFCAAGTQIQDKVRTIYQIKFDYDAQTEILKLTFYGNGFLYKMIRNLVGTILAVGNKRLMPTQVPKLLAAKDRNVCPPTAPAHGLCLLAVNYDV